MLEDFLDLKEMLLYRYDKKIEKVEERRKLVVDNMELMNEFAENYMNKVLMTGRLMYKNNDLGKVKDYSMAKLKRK